MTSFLKKTRISGTIFDIDELLEFAKLGTFIQYDLFGVECSYYQLNNAIDMPSDAVRIDNFVKLVEEGFEDKLLMAHDIHTKHRLVCSLVHNCSKTDNISRFSQTSFGGHGYHHINMNIIPRLFAKGLTVDQVDTIAVKNPAKWLQFNA